MESVPKISDFLLVFQIQIVQSFPRAHEFLWSFISWNIYTPWYLGNFFVPIELKNKRCPRLLFVEVKGLN